MALIKKAHDDDKSVRTAVFASLLEIGRKQPNLHLSSILDFMKKNPKLEQAHRITLLKSLQKILQIHLNSVLPDLCTNLIDLGMSEMLGSKDIIPDWQGEACDLLVALGTKFSRTIMEKLIENFPPGKIPHYFVMKLIGDLSTHSPAEVVPLLKDVIARTVPITNSVKKDNMRWVFSYAISHFCEAIVHFIANAESEDFGMQFVTYGSELYPTYEIMLNVWFTSKESKVRLMTAKAIGNLCAILPREQFDAQLPRLFPPILGLFKKEKDLLPVTQAVCNILEVGVQSAKAAIAEAEADPNALLPTLALEPLLPTVLSVIHPLCVQPVDESNPTSVKTNNELLRCHEVIGYAFPNTLISFLLERLDVTNPKSKDPNVRAGTLLIIRHMVDRIDSSLEGHKELLVIGMKTPVQTEQHPKVVKILSQVIISMSSKRYLELEGGEELVGFIVRQSAMTDEMIEKNVAILQKSGKTPAGTPGYDELRSLCDDILNISATAVPCMDIVLWPFLFEFIIDPKYLGATGIVSKAVGSLACRKREEWESGQGPDENAKDYYMIDFDRHVNVPRPQSLIARLFVMATGALRRNKQGENVLECLRACGPILHPEISALWDHALLKLVQFIQAKSANWVQQKWEDLILRLLAETIKVIADDSWTMRMGEELAMQIPEFANDSEYKANALKQLGLVLQKLNHKDFIRKKLALMFTSTNHSNDVERMGCAQGFGYCAATHLDFALEAVQDNVKPKKEEKKGGFFSSLFSSEPSGPSPDIVRTGMLCYGYIAAYGPPKLITSRLEVTILVGMRPYLQRKNNSLTVCETMIQVVDLLAKSVHPTHLRVDQFIFKARDELLRHVIDFISDIPPAAAKANPTHPMRVRILGLNACTTLLNLEPALAEDLESTLVKKITNFYNLASTKEPSAEEAASSSSSSSSSSSLEPAANPHSLKKLFQNLNETLSSLVFMNTTIPCLIRLLKHIEDYIKHADPEIRKQAITTTFHLLEKFVEYLSSGLQPSEDKFSQVGRCLSSIIPRVTDSEKEVRVSALQSTQYFLFIDHFLQTGMSKEDRGDDEEGIRIEMPEHLQALSEMVGRVESDELPSQFGAANELASVVCECLSEEELCHLLMSLLSGLTDADSSASSGTCIVLNSIIKLRGDQFLSKVSELITGMLTAMEKITHEKTINGTLHSIRTLSRHHPLPVINALINSPLPHSPHVVTSLQAIAKDSELLEILLDHLLDILNNSQCVVASGAANTASPESLAATCTLKYIFEVTPSSYLLDERFSQFVGTLLLRFGTTSKVGGKARKDLLDTFAAFAKQIEEDKLASILKDENASLSSDTEYPSGLCKLVAAFCDLYDELILPLYNFVLPYAKGNFKGQRLVVVTVYSEIMNWCKNEQVLQNVINALLISMNDEELRLQSIIGIGNSAAGGPELANRFASSVLDALMSVIDHKDEEISMEAMNGLDKVFQVVEPSRVQPVLINIIHRIRPHLEKKNSKIRASSFRLFGTLSRFGHGAAAELFKEQMHSTLPSALIHLADPDRNVQLACKGTVRKMVPLLGSEKLEAIVLRKWFDPNIKLPFDNFASDFAKQFVADFPELVPLYVMTIIEFFQSQWHPLRKAAATLAGDYLGFLPAKQRGTLNPGIITTAFIGLLTGQKEPSVREAAAKAIQLLYDY
eukprot:CAMPEP_0201485534 /NCGR_PEP_ID=MMETSP0151_2-20130828/9620_1 /ASSEMBLY_ACC=CAM_ASM_000257 /TAXON_ID=200890 /ORGANISM="Paramoeba atlantica, Strain 621/1 / CCAP 1560/9" /LENGTH=1664 /DNA_ID=CAMNT_0047869703 /DNA_START=126 /DNA_END=5120 /DNA_ORIENTATION=+